MLKDYPIIINGTAIPTPTTYKESPTSVESVNKSEAGTDLVITTRRDKLALSLDYEFIDSDILKMFKEFYEVGTLEVQLYDVIAETYRSRTMRVTAFFYELEKHSEKVRRTNGLWTLSMQIGEF